MTLASDTDPLPVSQLAEFAYCPRLFYLQHVEGRWEDNVYTEEGKEVHRRVDRLDHVLPDPQPPDEEQQEPETGDERPTISRSVSLSSERLGLSAKLDLVSTAADEAVPVEMKRGRVPDVPERSWESDRVQLMAQGLLLREHGYRCDHGVLYYAGSKTRVDVPFDGALEARTLELLAEARRAADSPHPPDPLENSPKCVACSLNGICLPDETLVLKALAADEPQGDVRGQAGSEEGAPQARASETRRLYPPRDVAVPLYVQEQGAKIGKEGQVLLVRKDDEVLSRVRLKDISQLVVLGNVSISTPVIHLLCEAGVPIVHFSTGHWFYGVTHGMGLKNAFLKEAQFRAAADPGRCLELARAVVWAKGANQRTFLLRNIHPKPTATAAAMKALLRRVLHAGSIEEVLGLEGGLAAQYFKVFGRGLKPRDFDAEWNFESRNRRPPKDPINALLSFGYAMLAKECTVALLAEGLDPWWGLFHQPRNGRPALALDLMEEFRPVIVDSAVLTAVNTGMVSRGDFTRSRAACMLNPSGRKAFLRAYEARLDQLFTHPIFGYRCSWRSLIRVQARLLGRWLKGDLPEYLPIRVR